MAGLWRQRATPDGGKWGRYKMRPTTIDQPLTSIPPVVDAVLRPINGVLTFVLSIIEATIRSLTDAIPAFFTEVLLVLNAISGVVHGIVSALDACVDPGERCNL